MKPALDRLESAHRSGQTLLLIFDYDGTMAAIAEHPRQARLAPNARLALQRLASTSRVHVGIVSGRAIDDLKNIVGIKGIDYAGTCGLELELNQIAVIPRGAIRAGEMVPSLLERLRIAIDDYPGAWIEQKTLGLTVHYRNVSPRQIAGLRSKVAGALDEYGAEWCRIDGPMAIEITPNRGITKGTAVRAIMERFGAESVFVLYGGDAANDTPALEFVAGLGGITIGIGDQCSSVAEYRLPDPFALAAFLQALHRRLCSPQANEVHCVTNDP